MSTPDPANPKVGDEFVTDEGDHATITAVGNSHLLFETPSGREFCVRHSRFAANWRPAPPPEHPLVDGNVVLWEGKLRDFAWLDSAGGGAASTGRSVELAVFPDPQDMEDYFAAANAGRQYGVWWERERT